MIVKSIVIAKDYESKETIGIYEYNRPLDKIGKECLSFWMNCMDLLYPKCSFEAINLKNSVGMVVICTDPDTICPDLFEERKAA